MCKHKVESGEKYPKRNNFYYFFASKLPDSPVTSCVNMVSTITKIFKSYLGFLVCCFNCIFLMKFLC